MSDYKFETLQLHVGQEEPDPASARKHRLTRSWNVQKIPSLVD